MENENHKIIIKKIDEEDIIFRESLIPKTIKPFRGTVSVYQVLWEKSTSRTTVRNMSCFDCDASEICSHGKHVGFRYTERDWWTERKCISFCPRYSNE